MKTFFADLIPKIQRFSRKLDDLTKLRNQHWVSISDIASSKVVFIFRENNQLIISDSGVVEKAVWEYLGNDSMLIDTSRGSYLLKRGFFDENVIALKLDSTDKYTFFVNETKYDDELNTVSDVLKFLESKYLKQSGNEESGRIFSRPCLKVGQLPNPNSYVAQMLNSSSSLLINTTINWKQFCDSHSDYYPIYTFRELKRRGEHLPSELIRALDEYAYFYGYNSFKDLLLKFPL